MSLTFRDADKAQMHTIEHLIAKAVLPFRDNTEAAIVVFALVRCARVLLNLYPVGPREALCKVLVGFLQDGKATARDVRESGLILPKGIVN